MDDAAEHMSLTALLLWLAVFWLFNFWLVSLIF